MRVVTTDAGLGRIEDGAVALLDTAFPHVGAVLEQEASLRCLALCAVRRRIDISERRRVQGLGTRQKERLLELFPPQG